MTGLVSTDEEGDERGPKLSEKIDCAVDVSKGLKDFIQRHLVKTIINRGTRRITRKKRFYQEQKQSAQDWRILRQKTGSGGSRIRLRYLPVMALSLQQEIPDADRCRTCGRELAEHPFARIQEDGLEVSFCSPACFLAHLKSPVNADEPSGWSDVDAGVDLLSHGGLG